MERLLHSGLTANKFGQKVCTRCLCRHLLRKENISKFAGEHMFLKRTVCQLQNIYAKDIVYFSRVPKAEYLKQWKHFSREFRAFSSMLHRSGFRTQADLSRLLYSQHRCFSTTRSCFNNQDRQQDQDEEDEEKKKDEIEKRLIPLFSTLFLLILLSLALPVMMFADNKGERDNMISWNYFQYGMLAKGEVKEIIVNPDLEEAFIYVYPGAVINNRRVDQNRVYRLKIADVHKFEEKVRKIETEMGITSENFVPITYRSNGIAALLLFTGMVLLLSYLLVKNTKVKFGSGMDMISGITKARFTRVDRASKNPAKRVAFADVAGLKEAKVEIMEFVDYLNYPEKYKALGGKIPKGALLLGPPGCGKTLLAKAVAAEAGVPFLAMAGSEFVEIVGGLGASRVRDLFKEARKSAPCIVYIDEIDAIGRKRTGEGEFSSGEEEQTLNQLLVELDGIGTTEGVIMLASTNRADVLDKALLRPGRFDRHITIDLPTIIERLEMFEMYLKQLKLTDPVSTYAPRLAQMTPGMSGADIANVCNEAALFAARQLRKSVGAGDFDYAVERVVAGIEKKTGVLTPTEKKVVAYHEAGHALVGWMLKHTDALLRISIVPRTNNTLGFAQYVPSDQKLYSTEQLFEKMCMALGGRAAEAVIFNRITTGAQDDLKRVTNLAFKQIKSFGMNEQIGPLSFPDEGDGLGTKPYSKKLGALMDEEAKALVGKAYRQAEKILLENKEKLHTLAKTLLEKEVVTYDEVESLIGEPPHGKKRTIDPVWIPAYNNNENSKSEKNNRQS